VIEAGTVGAVFSIRDDASAALERLAREFNELQVSIDKIKESMASIGAAEDGPIARLREQFAQVGRAGEDASGIIMGAFGKVDGAVDSSIQRVNALKESLAGAAREAEQIKIAPGMGGGGFGGGGSGSHEGGRGGFWNRLDHHVTQAGGDMASIVGGPLGVGLGVGVLGAEAFKQSFSVTESENNMRIAGVSNDKIAEADAIAGNYSRYGMSKLQALEAVRMGMVPLNRLGGSKDEGVDAAMGVLPTVARFDQLARAMHGEEGGDATKQLFELFKSDELRNKLSPGEAQKFIEDYAQIYTGTSGKVDPKTFYQGLKYSKSAGAQFSDEFTKYYLPGIEMEEGGSTAGTMLMTSASAFLGQRFKKPALGELRQMGIYDDHDKLQNQDRLIENPFRWMQETFMPALVKAGFDTKDKQVGEVEKLTSRNSAEAAVLLGINPGNVERNAQSIRQADTLNQSSAAIFANDPMAAARAVESSMANLASAFGQSVPSITGGLNNLAGALDWMAHINNAPWLKGMDDFIKDHSIMGNKTATDPGADARAELFRKLNPTGAIGSGGNSGPHGLAMIPNEPSIAAHAAISAPPVNVNVQPAVAMTTLPVTINVDNGGLFGKVTSYVDARISATLSGLKSAFNSSANNSSAGFDGRSAPSTPDGSIMHGSH
jgi:hypothetical protein